MKKYFLTLLAATSVQWATAQDNISSFIDSLAGKYHSSASKQPALVIGINHHGKEMIFTYGETDYGCNKKCDSTHLFEIGQITQAFTSILYADLTLKGIVHADDRVQKYLPVIVPSPVYQPIVCVPSPNAPGRTVEFDGKEQQPVIRYTPYVCFPDPASTPQPILLCYLSTHTSGLPDLPSNMKSKKGNPFSGYTREMMYEFLSDYKILSPIGYDFQYSSVGVALLGHVMELIAKKSYEELLRENIFSKLGMISTGVQLTDHQKNNLLSGYRSNGKKAELWETGIMAPCAGIRSNLADMMKFLSANVGISGTPLRDVLDYTHNPRIQFQNKKYGRSALALGWFVSSMEKSEDGEIVWQEGLTDGFASFIGFSGIRKTGVVILTNRASPVTKMGMEILQKLN